MSRVRFTVSFELPKGATRREALEYVSDAVETWRGQCHPPGGYDKDDEGDPMFGLDWSTVYVKFSHKPKEPK